MSRLTTIYRSSKMFHVKHFAVQIRRKGHLNAMAKEKSQNFFACLAVFADLAVCLNMFHVEHF